MDPLSITTAVAGLLKAVPAVVSTIKDFIDKTKDAPHQAEIILQESTDFKIILSQLQSHIVLRNPASSERSGHILAEQVVLTLTGSVLTFSELQEVLDTLKVSKGNSSNSDSYGVLDRVKWVMKEAQIDKIIQRLQNHKASLACMLNIMNVQSLNDVHESVANLTTLMTAMLSSNQDLVRRMESLDTPPHLVDQATIRDIDQVTITDNFDHRQQSETEISSLSRERFKFDFDDDLKTSRVYRKVAFDDPHLSLPSIEAPSVTWSILSGLSLSQISNISVFALPIVQSELFNAQQYDPPGLAAKKASIKRTIDLFLSDPLIPRGNILIAERFYFQSSRAIKHDYHYHMYARTKCEILPYKPDEAPSFSALTTVSIISVSRYKNVEWALIKPMRSYTDDRVLVPILWLELVDVNTGGRFEVSLEVLKEAGVPVEKYSVYVAQHFTRDSLGIVDGVILTPSLFES